MSSRIDPQPPARDSAPQRSGRPSATHLGEPEGVDLLEAVRRMSQISRDFHARNLTRPLSQSYRAWRNEHSANSKYLGPGFKGRSRLFVPKSRMAVRKNLATAAAALFSSEDVANVSAVYEDDKAQVAIAAVKKELMNYRLTRGFTPTSINWFLVAGGGMMDSQLTGVTISKQYWEFQTAPSGETEKVLVPSEDGELDELGQPVLEEQERPIMKVVMDRPMIDLVPIENCEMDPAAPWFDPVGLGAWFFVRYPMYVSEAKARMRSDGQQTTDQGWLNPDDIEFSAGMSSPDDRSALRRVREGGSDRYEQAKQTGDWELTWLVERFIRVNGRDLHFWTVGEHAFASKIRDVEEVYPAMSGERPYRMGVAGIETHRILPMSPVESWQPLQLELNDIANLRLDTLKRSIAPLAIIKRGARVDLNQVNRRGQPEAHLMVTSKDDVTFEQTPGPSSTAYTETSVSNALFDELAGVYSTSSVASNRQLNETVGGMQLTAGAANAVSEFDLRVWIETWVEPVLRQVSKLIDYYESDPRALQIAGAKAQAWSRYRMDPTLDDLGAAEVQVRVNVGIGSSDPMQRMGKMKAAMEMLTPLFGAMEAQGVVPNMEAIIEEIMGHAGFKDGRRFFNFGKPPEESAPQPDPVDMRKLDIEEKKIDAGKEKTKEESRRAISMQRMKERENMAKHLSGIAEGARARQEGFDNDGAARAEGFENEGRARAEGFENEGKARQETAKEARLNRVTQALGRNKGLDLPPDFQRALPPPEQGGMPMPPPQQPMQQSPLAPRPADPITVTLLTRQEELMRMIAQSMAANDQERQMQLQILARVAQALEASAGPKKVITDQNGEPVAIVPMQMAAGF